MGRSRQRCGVFTTFCRCDSCPDRNTSFHVDTVTDSCLALKPMKNIMVLKFGRRQRRFRVTPRKTVYIPIWNVSSVFRSTCTSPGRWSTWSRLIRRAAHRHWWSLGLLRSSGASDAGPMLVWSVDGSSSEGRVFLSGGVIPMFCGIEIWRPPEQKLKRIDAYGNAVGLLKASEGKMMAPASLAGRHGLKACCH